ncbi:DUF5994 family protein [Yinghuangia soli]|uniref:DUF5994 family protein n=1 Tax=Yinghuangia soli TaxID=2908204 RepID=A0AA41PVB0_9ACTN|nr:DUF5994 family protein [Yinghuangia soli]MCF2526010.1 DUF5994 family protein [Yinghuangia soli]
MPTPENANSPWGIWGPPWSPLLPRLALLLDREGMFDGAWWPRSDDAQTELTDLVTAVGAHIGPVLRIGIHHADWRSVPQAVLTEAAPAKVSPLSTTAHTVHLAHGLEDHVLLLVVPPDTDEATAAAAMARAASAGNRATAADLLAGRENGARPAD